jgi:hypothetical protein
MKPQQIPNATTTLCSQGEPRKAEPGWLQTSPAMTQGRRSKKATLLFASTIQVDRSFCSFPFNYLRLFLQYQ